MDRRSWPWKKKSSYKEAIEKALFSATSSPAATSDIGDIQVHKGNRDGDNKKPKHVKISVESYMYLTGLEDRVKSNEEQVETLEDEVMKLNEKLSEAHSEITDKDNLAKQHAKVAEEAILGWEKLESEAAMLKTQVESVTLLKLAAEDRALHLDGALKEGMRQYQNLKEEHEQKLQELAMDRKNIFDKMKHELESQISNLEQDFLNSAAENAALLRSLRERSNILIKTSEEKSQADAEIVFLKSKLESSEKEKNSLNYELHISRKELEIRSEEKNMSVRSLEVANKQYLEGVKKITKLEAECQRLRGLVRKKLPGPAAVAQMKLELENSGRDYNEPRLRRSSRSPLKPTTTHFSQMPEWSMDNSIKFKKENELLTARLMAVDEERRVLKEALENHKNPQTTSKLQSLEACGPGNAEVSTKGFSNKDECDDNVSCAGSWATVSISGNSYVQKEKNTDTPCTPENISHLGLMDDFLEMEKLAHMSNGDANDQGLQIAISHVYDFVMTLGKEAKLVLKASEEDGLMGQFDAFDAKYAEAINKKINLGDFIHDVSRVLNKAGSLQFSFLGFKSPEVETCDSSDCIDKIALPENKAVVELSGENYSNSCSKFPGSISEPDIAGDGDLVLNYEPEGDSGKCSLEEFKLLKVNKDKLEADLARCTEDFERTKSRLLETEKLLANAKSELTLAQKSNSLAETQLKCMAESYRMLETKADELQNEVNFLNGKLDNLDKELQEERRGHQEAAIRCTDLLEQLQRIDICEAAGHTSRENELASAAEKLAECQETIFLLDKQLRALRPQNNVIGQKVKVATEDKGRDIRDYFGPPEADIYMTKSFSSRRTSTEYTLDHLLNGPPSPSESISKGSFISTNDGPKLAKTRSGLSSSSSTPTPEKHARGISRFFTSKGKSAHLVA